MKKILFSILLLASMPTFAQHHHHGYWSYRSGPSPWVWVAPAIIGGVIGYEIARPPVVVQQPPPYVVPPTVVTSEVCSPWTQVRNPDGTTTYTRTCQ